MDDESGATSCGSPEMHHLILESRAEAQSWIWANLLRFIQILHVAENFRIWSD